jgi:hypothetical protein
MSVAYLFRAAKARTGGPFSFPDHLFGVRQLVGAFLSLPKR